MERLADRYAFRTLLGEGGAGTVYEVENLSLGRLEALKILTNPFTGFDVQERFAVEARIAASLEHPHIVGIHAFGQDGGVPWYSMQLIDGPSLAGILDGGRTLDGPMAAQLAVPVLEALAFSHAHGVIHRDIKPANILFDAAGTPFLADFGIAKAVENPMDTRTGHMLGTPAFVAPEQALGEAVDARADLYSLGVTLYRALAGQLPFRSDQVLQTLLLRLQEEAPPLEALCPGLHPALAAVIMRSLARDRDRRWEGAAEMREAFLAACAEAGMAWDRPLAVAGEFSLRRRTLEEVAPTADMPGPKGRPWWILGLAALGAGALLFVLRGPRLAARVEPPPPAPAAAPAAAAPAPKPRPRPAQAEVLPRRPVTYPRLLDDGLAPAPVGECAGLSVGASLVVGEDGRVKSCRILSAVKPGCAEAARAVAMKYRFSPALDDQGRPVEAAVAVAVDFQEAR